MIVIYVGLEYRCPGSCSKNLPKLSMSQGILPDHKGSETPSTTSAGM